MMPFDIIIALNKDINERLDAAEANIQAAQAVLDGEGK